MGNYIKNFIENFTKGTMFLGIIAIGLSILFFSWEDKKWFGIILGGIMILIGIGLMIYKSLPKKKIKTESLVGKVISYKDIDNLHPPLKKIGIAGLSGVGKTTLCDLFREVTVKKRRTKELSVYITLKKTNPIEYIGIIDGEGDVFEDRKQVLKQV